MERRIPLEKQKISQSKDTSRETPEMEKLDPEKLEDVAGGLSASQAQLGSIHRKSPLPF